MRIHKRLTVSLLAFAMVATSSFAGLADTGLGGNTNSGGSINVGSDAAYAHKFMCYPENQGYRISIVDQTGDRVTNSIDIVNYVPTDINNIGYNNSNNGGGRQEFIDGYNKYKEYIGWTDYTGTGVNKSNRFYYSNGIKTEEFSGKTWNKNGVPVGYNKQGERVETNMYPKSALEQYLTVMYNAKVTELTEKGIKNLTTLDIDNETIKIPLPSVLNSSKTGFEPGGELLMQYLSTAVGKLGVEDTEKKEDITEKVAYNVLSLLVDMPMQIYNNKGQIVEGKKDYLFRFTDPAEQARVGTEEIDKQTGEKFKVGQSDIITEKGYKVVIEPLYWFVPEYLTLDPDLLAKTGGSINFGNVTGVCYGTVSYILKYAWSLKDNLNITDEQTHKCWVGPNWGTGGLGVTTLMLARNDNDLKIYEPSIAPEPLTRVGEMELWSLHSTAYGENYRNVGYAVHIYDNLLNPDETSTFDEINYSSSSIGEYRPGPSEDTSERGGKEAQNNIVKFYSKKTGDTYIYKSNFTREDTIGSIKIEDELDGGYKVDDWFVSSTFKKPTSNSDDYGNWKSSLDNKQSGTASGNVTLNKSETLYVRLVETPKVVKVYTTGENVDKIEIDKEPEFSGDKLVIKTPDNGYDYQTSVQTPENKEVSDWAEVPSGKESTETIIKCFATKYVECYRICLLAG